MAPVVPESNVDSATSRRRLVKMRSVDKMMLIMTGERNPLSIDVLFLCEPQCTASMLLKMTDLMLEKYEKLRVRVGKTGSCCKAVCWETMEGLDKTSFVLESELPAGDSIQSHVSKIVATLLPTDLPSWCIHLIHDQAGDQDILLVRCHHSIADGLALVHLLDDMFFAEEQSAAGYVPPAASKAKRVRKTFPLHAWIVAFISSFFMLPYFVLKLLCMRGDRHSSIKKANSELSSARSVSWSDPIPLHEMKQVGVKYRATINDIIMCCCSIALREYTLAKEGAAAVKDIRVVVPVSVRQLRYSGEVQLDNRVSCVFMSLPLTEPDPVKSLRKVKKQMDQLKRSPESLVMYFLLKMMVTLLPSSMCKYLESRFYDKCSLTITNVPGKTTQGRLGGGLVKTMVPWVPLVGNGQLGMACFSYNGTVLVSVLSDSNTVDDPEIITQHFVQAFRDLQKRAAGGSS